MSESPAAAAATPSGEPLQFDHAETATPVAPCAHCQRALTEAYFTVGTAMFCPACREALAAELQGGSRAGRAAKALALGLGAAVLGAVVYALVRHFTDIEFGLLYAAVGWFVGTAVRRGSGGMRGGWFYQAMAMALTWLAISLSCIPMFVDGLAQGDHPLTGPAAWIVASVLSMGSPVIIGMDSPLMILIQGFAFWEAWKLNKRVTLAIEGPFQVAPPAPPAAEPAAQEQQVG